MYLKKAYYYLFYKLYKFWEYISIPRFWSDVKASLSIDLLILFTIASIFFYFDLSFGSKTKFLICLILMLFVSNYLFLRNSNWKDYINHFEKLSKTQNNKGTIIVCTIIILILINFIYSIYWMDRRAQYNGTGPYSKEYLNNKATQ
ncbi:hypothetical protein IQ37_12740 [Chryseobacterium piperi]|uniref:Uncharacterized protein n=1 Tax=Chryseobacterium piperi TaxID=558152 RepID=A0A086B7R2_9FLAO|nr:hypothetical protein CJF12_19950 [Chryseobacterium piperi]KFF24976.1 hypothetical protein IQ37_12740 [Chryseobacterium piperi]